DQLLVNTAAQVPANPNTAKPKESDGRDFNSMVNQRRSEGKSETKSAKTEKTGKTTPTQEQGDTTAQPDGERLAVAAAMLIGPQPGLRIEPMTEETDTAIPELTMDTPAAEAPQESVKPENLEIPVPQQTDAETQTVRNELPTETENAPLHETVNSGKAEQVETQKADPEQKAAETEKAPEQTDRRAETGKADTQRVDRQPEQTRTVRRAEHTQVRENTENETDTAQLAQSGPALGRTEQPETKVVEAPRPIPLEAEDGVEQLGRELDDIIVNSADADRVEITLTPENLGKLTVEIMRGENGRLEIVLHPSTERAANLLEKNTAGLQNALRPTNQNEVEVQVRPSDESQRQFLDPNGQNRQDNRQQQQQQNDRRRDRQDTQDFLQQLRLGLVDNDGQ
ncbi:MAG: flagellar hook-length control protein FliK, partial [Oscillospiraceae bacterium]|nr:flagellar hook-length control protein FliK [Oscillospiraceae bacterium]